MKKSVVVITPSIGSSKLVDAINSVQEQTYSNIKHLIVIDGGDYASRTLKIVSDNTKDKKKQVQVSCTPENTGGPGFYGHRIYAAYPHLVNSEYVFFLDEDNWYDPNHIETLVNTIEKDNLDFAYSLRKIYNVEKEYMCDDNCESLGKWPIFINREHPSYLIDTSAYAFKRQFLNLYTGLWHWGWGGDRRFYNLVKDKAKHDTSGKHTLCYRLDGNEGSVTADFFTTGNKSQFEYYQGDFPWIKG